MTKPTPRTRRQSPTIQARNALWAKRYEAGETLAEIGCSDGRSETAVYQALEGLVDFRQQGRRNEVALGPTPEAAAKYRRAATMYENGWSMREIAQEFGVTRYAVNKWIRAVASGVCDRPGPGDDIAAEPVPSRETEIEAANREFVARLRPVIARCFPGARI